MAMYNCPECGAETIWENQVCDRCLRRRMDEEREKERNREPEPAHDWIDPRNLE
jgi:hypothetical protein